MIKYENGKPRYFDRNGKEITEGCMIKFCHGDKSMEQVEEVYLTKSGELGTDATNPKWLEKGWAAPCEYGIYVLTEEDTEMVEVVE